MSVSIDWLNTFNKWHLEISSYCQLACLRCERTLSPDQFVQRMLPLLTVEKVLSSKPSEVHIDVLLCGNFGDPIYHREFHEIIGFLKSISCRIVLVTNGSGRDLEWWEKTTSILTKEDTIQFSIDGLMDTNHIYRKGANWQSIEKALSHVGESSIQSQWKFIIFRHNQHQIEEAKRVAKQMGIGKFILVKSGRFGSLYCSGDQDPLQPDDKFVNNVSRLTEHTTERGQLFLSPLCKKKDGAGYFKHFVSSEGFFSPCCWTSIKGGYENPFFLNRENFDLNTYSLEEILSSKIYKDLSDKMGNYELAPEVCKRFCTKKKNDPSFRSRTDRIEEIVL